MAMYDYIIKRLRNGLFVVLKDIGERMQQIGGTFESKEEAQAYINEDKKEGKK